MDENKQTSYKGIIIFLAIFAVVAITTTMVMSNLYLEKSKTDTSKEQPSVFGDNSSTKQPEDIGRTEVDTTYVIDLDEFYMTNNLKTEEIDFVSGDVVINSQYAYSRKYEENITYIQIDGLKDGMIERKINEELKDKAFEILQHEDIDKFAIAEVKSSVTANFSNILSVEITSNLYNERYYEEGSVEMIEYLNYNLTNGEQIQLEEVFADGVSVKELLTERLYKDYSYYEDSWAYSEYVWENTGKNYWSYDYENREEEIKKLGLMSEEEWLAWKYRSKIEENVMKDLLMIKNKEMDFIIRNSYITLMIPSEDYYRTGFNLREIHDKVTIYKKFLTDESIFTDEYDLAHQELCGWNLYENEEIYFPVENMLILKDIYDDQCLYSEIFELVNEKLDAEIEYAKANKEKFFIAKMTVYDSACDYDKVEFDLQDYEKNKNDILKRIYRYVDEPFARKSELEELGIDYVLCETGYMDVVHNRQRCILDSAERILTNEEVNKINLESLNLAYNEIFARYGHDFVTKNLRAYFGTKIWYKPIAGKTVSLEELTDIEKYNLELIRNRIAELKSQGITE